MLCCAGVRHPIVICIALATCFGISSRSAAHPMVENALDVVNSPDKIVIDARVSMEEILLVEASAGATPSRDRWAELSRAHGDYVLKHLRVRVDGVTLTGR